MNYQNLRYKQSPADKFAKCLRDQAKADEKAEWLEGLDPSLFREFIEDGLRPFLEHHLYKLAVSTDKLVVYLKAWGFAHTYCAHHKSKEYQVSFLKHFHYGGDDEYNWFMNRIPLEAWTEFCAQWSATEFLDDSEAGRAQQEDLCNFAWACLDLDGSVAHQMWLGTMDGHDSDDEGHIMQQENLNLFGYRRSH